MKEEICRVIRNVDMDKDWKKSAAYKSYVIKKCWSNARETNNTGDNKKEEQKIYLLRRDCNMNNSTGYN